MSRRAWINASLAAAVLWLLIFGLASAAFADPITGCVTSPPSSASFTSSYHLIVGAWEDAAGCNPSGPNARPTAGPYEREFFADGTQGVTVFAALFKPCGSTQMDIREVDQTGAIVGYHDFIYNTGIECGETLPKVLQPRPEPFCPRGCIYQPVPVPEPASFPVVAIVLTALAVSRRRIAWH